MDEVTDFESLIQDKMDISGETFQLVDDFDVDVSLRDTLKSVIKACKDKTRELIDSVDSFIYKGIAILLFLILGAIFITIVVRGILPSISNITTSFVDNSGGDGGFNLSSIILPFIISQWLF